MPAGAETTRNNGSSQVAILCGLAVLGFVFLGFVPTASAQITIDSKTGVVTNDSNGHVVNTVDRRYQQISPTKVPLTKSELDPKTRLELIRLMQAEQGFAMRPFPRGHKGLTLEANGKLEPAGEQYLNMATAQGISAKPGDRVVITDVKIEHARIVFDLNGGPDPKHRLLRHILRIVVVAGQPARKIVGRVQVRQHGLLKCLQSFAFFHRRYFSFIPSYSKTILPGILFPKNAPPGN